MRAQILRFLLVGGLATLIHYSILILLVQTKTFEPVIASNIGFSISAFFNYILNRKHTFRSTRRHDAALPRFAIVATTGLMINTFLLWLISTVLGLHYLIAQVIATGTTLIWNFWLNRVWTFGTDEKQPQSEMESPR